jgi:pimeloyl-ACP methyl ester carboxylesterase
MLLAAAVSTAGCGADNAAFLTEDRMANGLVIILPGIEGVSSMNRNIRAGLVDAGVYRAMPIYSWGRPIPGVGMLLNQMDFVGNRLAGARIARMIVEYQSNHPGRPVHVIGHSGGGGVAVFVAEGMPPEAKLNGLILLSASIWHGYDLTKALSRCKSGIVNFYNRQDSALLGLGTTLTSNVDGMRGPSAGLIGFKVPDDPAKRSSYRRLYQREITSAMGYGDPHAAATEPHFVSTYVAGWLRSGWPTADARPIYKQNDRLASARPER